MFPRLPQEIGMAPSPRFDRLARGSSRLGSTVLGSVNWAFVITLLLLLGFIFMWWTAADERDKTKADLVKTTADNTNLVREGNALVVELDATTKVIGFLSDKTLKFGPQSAATVDREKAVEHLRPNGEVEAKDAAGNPVLDAEGKPVKAPGMLNMLRNLKLKMLDSVRTASGVPADAAKTVEFTWMTAPFKSKLKEGKALLDAMPPAPAEPMDKSDEVRMAKYRADLEEYTTRYEAYFGSKEKNKPGFMERLTAEFPNESKQFKELIAGQPFDPDTSKEIEVLIGYLVTATELSNFQGLMLQFEMPLRALIADYKVNKETDVQTIATVRGQLKAANDEIAAQATRYQALVDTSTGELAKKDTELGLERAKAAKNEQDARKAENDYEVLKKETKATTSKDKAEIAAMRARIESQKEGADLEIRRNEVDGTLLAVSNASETGTIDIGSNAKAYPGLKFLVSFVDRGGARQNIGEVQIIKVTGPNSSQVRIVSAAQPLVSGHLLSNPLFSASRAIHIYPLGWSPDVVQQRRLDEMNVIVDKAPSGATDYFVVPDEWKGGVTAPKEGEDPAAAATNPLDSAKQEALRFGATVITRRMLDTFLRL
jgi:hypothetical protein